MTMDLRAAFNALSDVVVNRPELLRDFDQIQMKVADMLLQVEHLGRWLDKKSLVCVGDGDAIGLSLVYLNSKGLLAKCPDHIHVLDFDERVVNAVNRFVDKFKLNGRMSAELYNIVSPLPKAHWGAFDAFYTNPPFGASNEGRSVIAFLRRGLEASKPDSVAAVVVADYKELQWTYDVLTNTQKFLLDNGYAISEMLPEFHHYHLDDKPDLTSCSLVATRRHGLVAKSSLTLPKDQLDNFYGSGDPLKVLYVRESRKKGDLPSDVYFEYLEGETSNARKDS